MDKSEMEQLYTSKRMSDVNVMKHCIVIVDAAHVTHHVRCSVAGKMLWSAHSSIGREAIMMHTSAFSHPPLY